MFTYMFQINYVCTEYFGSKRIFFLLKKNEIK